jgi:hypothetical protein
VGCVEPLNKLDLKDDSGLAFVDQLRYISTSQNCFIVKRAVGKTSRGARFLSSYLASAIDATICIVLAHQGGIP